MKTTDEKYNRIIKVLRDSRPEVSDLNDIEDEVMKRISGKPEVVSGFFDFFFGWIYVGWVRRSLVAASFALLGFFLWQQNNILNQIDDLNEKVGNNKITTYNPSDAIEKRLILFRLSQERSGNMIVREEDLTRLLDSLNDLNIRYRDLLEMIDEYPGLKKIVEENQKKLQSRIKL